MENDLKGKNVFLSGPMMGKEARNRDAFNAAERLVRARGAEFVRNPARISSDGSDEPEIRHAAMLGALSELCDAVYDPETGVDAPFYDVLALLPDWKRSNGAKTERMVAELVGIGVIEVNPDAE